MFKFPYYYLLTVSYIKYCNQNSLLLHSYIEFIYLYVSIKFDGNFILVYNLLMSDINQHFIQYFTLKVKSGYNIYEQNTCKCNKNTRDSFM